MQFSRLKEYTVYTILFLSTLFIVPFLAFLGHWWIAFVYKAASILFHRPTEGFRDLYSILANKIVIYALISGLILIADLFGIILAWLYFIKKRYFIAFLSNLVSIIIIGFPLGLFIYIIGISPLGFLYLLAFLRSGLSSTY